MAATVIGYLTQSLAAVTSWLSVIFSASGMLSFFLFMFSIYSVTRLLLSPIFGRIGSDRAKKAKSGSDGDSNE